MNHHNNTDKNNILYEAFQQWLQTSSSSSKSSSTVTLPPSSSSSSAASSSLSSTTTNTTNPLDLRGSYPDAVKRLKQWLHTQLQQQQQREGEYDHTDDADDVNNHQQIYDNFILRPVQAVMSNQQDNTFVSHPLDDSERVISHVRSFGLSTTVGARGDAVSMLYQLNNHNNNNEYNHHHHHNDNHNHNGNAIAVVKVIKSRNVFIQELACFYLLDKIFSPSYYQSHPTSHIYFPHYICSISSYIPTNPGIGRIYAITLQHDTPKDYCEGGVLVMSCAPGKPIAELFALNNNNNNHNHNNDNNNNSNLINSNTILSRHDQYNRLIIIIQECARVLAEFHYSTSYYNPIPSNNNNIYIDSIIYQIEDMFNKLSLTQYSYILQQHDISLSSLQETLKIFKLLLLQYEYEYEYIPTHTCILHGDAHAGNMLWDDILKRVTLIDLPTMLLTIQIDNIPSSSASSSSSSSTSSSSLSSSTSLPSSSSSLPSLSSSLSYHGTGYASRDTCHFERKLQSHGIRRGLLHHEIKQLQIQFKQVYEFEIKQYNNKNNHNHNHNNNNSSNNNDNIPVCLTTPLFDLFFTYRSLMGELTQLVKYDDEHIDEEIKVQLQECIDKAQLLLKEWQEKKNNKQ